MCVVFVCVSFIFSLSLSLFSFSCLSLSHLLFLSLSLFYSLSIISFFTTSSFHPAFDPTLMTDREGTSLSTNSNVEHYVSLTSTPSLDVRTIWPDDWIRRESGSHRSSSSLCVTAKVEPMPGCSGCLLVGCGGTMSFVCCFFLQMIFVFFDVSLLRY